MSVTAFNIFAISLHIFLFIATWLGNCFVCVAIWRVRVLRTVSNMVIFSLALADLLMTVAFLFRVILLLSEEDFPTACHAISETSFYTICVIILHLTTISVDRFIAIKFPLRYKTIVTRRRMKVAVLLNWLSPLVGTVIFPYSLSTEVYEDFVDYYDSFHLCISTAHDHKFENTSKIFAAIIIVLYIVLPFIVTLGSYIYIMKVSRDQQLKLENEAQLERETMRKLEIRVAVTYGIIIGAFMVCFLPLLIGTLYQQFKIEHREKMTEIMKVFTMLASISACVNPVVYTCRNGEFRKAFKKMITRKNEEIRNQSINLE